VILGDAEDLSADLTRGFDVPLDRKICVVRALSSA